MRRAFLVSLGLLALLAVSSCGQKQEAAQSQSTVDSLLASNPSEQQQPGNLTPQSQYQEPAKTAPPTPAPKPSTKPASGGSSAPKSTGVRVPSGTAFMVAVTAHITSETAQPGDTWTGTVKDPVIVGDRVAIPAGSPVTGVVSGVKAAEKGSRAVLVLAIKSVSVNGVSHAISAGADSMIAGSTRTRNVGAVAGGAAAGALIGKAIGGSGKGALIGGLIGGAAATGAVAASKGYQVEVKEGAEISFTVNETVVMN